MPTFRANPTVHFLVQVHYRLHESIELKHAPYHLRRRNLKCDFCTRPVK
jgi:hypothetical protein